MKRGIRVNATHTLSILSTPARFDHDVFMRSERTDVILLGGVYSPALRRRTG